MNKPGPVAAVSGTLALVVGPMLERMGRKLPAVAALIDGLTVGGIVTVSLFELMPEAGAHLGWWALVLFVLGLCLPLAAERALVKSSNLRASVGVLVLLLFVAHIVIEGAALVSKSYDERVGLATLVVVVGHRLPLAALLWGQASRRYGRAIAMATLLAAYILIVSPRHVLSPSSFSIRPLRYGIQASIGGSPMVILPTECKLVFYPYNNFRRFKLCFCKRRPKYYIHSQMYATPA